MGVIIFLNTFAICRNAFKKKKRHLMENENKTDWNPAQEFPTSEKKIIHVRNTLDTVYFAGNSVHNIGL